MTVRAGASSIKINNEVGRQIQGASVDNRADYIRDDLEANAFVLVDASTAVMLVSCDIAGLPPEYTRKSVAAMAEAVGFHERDILITATHTHTGPSVIPTNPAKPVDEEYLDGLIDRLTELARSAVERLRPARVGWATGQAKLGYNRRVCWADGTHVMNADPRTPKYTGMEGAEDTGQVVLLALDEDDHPIAVMHCNAGHPTCFYGENFYSADYPGVARAYLREALGEGNGGDLPVLYINGAFGDMERHNALSRFNFPESRERNMQRIAHLLTGETLRCLHEMSFQDTFPLVHRFEDMEAEVRLPSADRLTWARDIMARFDGGEDLDRWDRMMAFGVKSLHDKFADDPVDVLPIHVVRIGDLALVTQPCELYSQFGLDIKRRSPAAITAVGGIADGYRGYLPTVSGVIGGGYSGEPIHWARFTPETGYRLVDVAAKLLYEVWDGGAKA